MEGWISIRKGPSLQKLLIAYNHIQLRACFSLCDDVDNR